MDKIISISLGEIQKVTVYYIIYQSKFLNILIVISISLFGYNFFFFSRYYNTAKLFQKEKSMCDESSLLISVEKPLSCSYTSFLS